MKIKAQTKDLDVELQWTEILWFEIKKQNTSSSLFQELKAHNCEI